MSDQLGHMVAEGTAMDVTMRLRAACGHDSRSVDGCTNCEAADAIECLRRDLDENAALRERMADLLRRTVVALRGPEPPLTRWSWHDLPERAAAAVAAIEVMQLAAALAADGERPNDKG